MHHNYWAHMPQLLSPRATTTEAHAPRARAPQQEKPLLAPTRESLRTATKTQHSQKKKSVQKKKNKDKNFLKQKCLKILQN